MTTRQRFGVLLLSTVLYGVLIASRHRGPGLPAPPPPVVVTPEMNRAAESVTRFSLDLFRRVAARTDDNLILSPYSLAGPLHLLIEGARGKTAREIGNVLHLPATSADPNNAELPWRTSETSLAVAQLNRRLMSRDDALPQSHLEALQDLEQQLSAVQQRIRSRSTRFWQDDFATERELVERVNAWRTRYKPFELGVAHALWVDQRFPLRPDYLTVATDVFNAGLFSVDFHQHSEVTRERVNAWVAEQTRSRIASVLPPGLLSRETRMLLTNATYFRGEWLHPFPAHLTRHEDFTTGKGVTTQGPLMSTSGEFRYAEFRPDGSLNELEKIPAGAESVYAFNWNLPANPDGVKVVEVPYKGDLLTFVALLPGKPDGFSALDRNSTSQLYRGGSIVPRFKTSSCTFRGSRSNRCWTSKMTSPRWE